MCRDNRQGKPVTGVPMACRAAPCPWLVVPMLFVPRSHSIYFAP